MNKVLTYYLVCPSEQVLIEFLISFVVENLFPKPSSPAYYPIMDLSNSTAALSRNSTRKVVTTKTVYVFDPTGNLLGQYCSVSTCAKKLSLGRPRINAGLQRGSIVDSRYYISYEKEFDAKRYNHAHNPLVPRTQHPRGSRSQAGFLSSEFFDVIH